MDSQQWYQNSKKTFPILIDAFIYLLVYSMKEQKKVREQAIIVS